MLVTPNRLTVFRVLIASTCPLILFWYRSFVVDLVMLVAFTMACITDWLDGYLARKQSMVTSFGKIVDPIADKLLIVGFMLVFAFFRQYSMEWVLVIMMREISVTSVRLIRLRQGRVLPAERAGKIKVGFQIGSVYATLIYLIAFDSGFFYASEPIFLFILQSIHYLCIFLATLFTVWSGISFFYRLQRI